MPSSGIKGDNDRRSDQEKIKTKLHIAILKKRLSHIVRQPLPSFSSFMYLSRCLLISDAGHSARKVLRLFLQGGFFLCRGLEYKAMRLGMTCGVDIDIGNKALKAG